jgi:hypothetical protein
LSTVEWRTAQLSPTERSVHLWLKKPFTPTTAVDLEDLADAAVRTVRLERARVLQLQAA